MIKSSRHTATSLSVNATIKTSQSPSAHVFSTQRENDDESGLVYFRARHYLINTGRFISFDPIRSDTGLSQYAYTRNNPANSIDPLGTFDFAYHESITKTALRGIFSEQAISKIIGSAIAPVSGNLGQDNPGNYNFVSDPRHHFDNNEIREGTQYITDEYALISSIGSHGEKSPEEEILWAFGRLLHATQDFWSHSNYVELWLEHMKSRPPSSGRTRIAPIPEFVYTPEITVLTPYDIPRVPIPPQPRSPLSGGNLHTGFYGVGPEFMTAGAETHEELNKDNPGKSSTLILGFISLVDSKRGGAIVKGGSYCYFDYAYMGAVKSTMEAATLFNSSIKTNMKYRHINWSAWTYPGAQR